MIRMDETINPSETPPRPWYKPAGKDLCWMAGLLAFGFGGMWLFGVVVRALHVSLSGNVELRILQAIAACQLLAIGAGFGAPFKRKLQGIGVMLFLIVLFGALYYFKS